MNDPSDNIYSSFALFMQAAQLQDITEMSAGVNWSKTPECVKDLLQFELSQDVSYRNYGRSAGGKIITDIIEYCERVDAGSRDRIHCALTNGATDGAHCLMSYLLGAEILTEDAEIVMVGMAFPVYSSLMKRLGIRYSEVFDDRTIVPEISTLLEAFARIQPSVIILALPHNPSGVLQDPSYYQAIMEWAADNNCMVFVDRVCLMPWDNGGPFNALFFQYIERNVCFVIDSPSKSNSLAGIRLGYLLMGARFIEGFERELRCRSLNPVVFGSLTLALCRLGDLCFHKGIGPAKTIARFVRKNLKYVYSQYPSDFTPPDIDSAAFILKFIADYCRGITHLHSRILKNLDSIITVFGGLTNREIVLDGGFNLLISTDKMKPEKEISDQENLATRHGVCVLTQRCFQPDAARNGHYFLRLSLSVPEEGFRRALDSMKDYYEEA